MYKLKEGVELEQLRKYGFKPGTEYKDYEDCICNEQDYKDFWLIPTDSEGNTDYADEEEAQPLWSVQVRDNRTLWIECVPSDTYHIDGMDMEEMFYALFRMIKEGLLDDNYGQI